jgi:hypothetical protein
MMVLARSVSILLFEKILVLMSFGVYVVSCPVGDAVSVIVTADASQYWNATCVGVFEFLTSVIVIVAACTTTQHAASNISDFIFELINQRRVHYIQITGRIRTHGVIPGKPLIPTEESFRMIRFQRVKTAFNM